MTAVKKAVIGVDRDALIMIYLGFASLALVIGVLIGSSNSPVVGSFLAILVALVGTALGALKVVDTGKGRPDKSTVAGLLLVSFSIALIVGAFAGEQYRNSGSKDRVNPPPWTTKNQPTDTREALDWLVVMHKLSAMGHSQNTIKQIYEIRVLERNNLEKQLAKEMASDEEEFFQTVVYDSSSPFHETLLRTTLTTSASRGLASKDEN